MSRFPVACLVYAGLYLGAFGELVSRVDRYDFHFVLPCEVDDVAPLFVIVPLILDRSFWAFGS